MNIVHKLHDIQGKAIEPFSNGDPRKENCRVCNREFIPAPEQTYVTKWNGLFYLCSDNCRDEWLQWTRYLR